MLGVGHGGRDERDLRSASTRCWRAWSPGDRAPAGPVHSVIVRLLALRPLPRLLPQGYFRQPDDRSPFGERRRIRLRPARDRLGAGRPARGDPGRQARQARGRDRAQGGASAASASTPAPSPARRCARRSCTSPATASAASTARPTPSSRTSRMEDLLFRTDQVIRHEIDVTRHQLLRNGVDIYDGHARRSSIRTRCASTTSTGARPPTHQRAARRHRHRHARPPATRTSRSTASASSPATTSVSLDQPAAHADRGRRRRDRPRVRQHVRRARACG